MELKEIMMILIASMLVFLPFVILCNPKMIAKLRHKDQKTNEDNTNNNQNLEQNSQSKNNDNYIESNYNNEQ